ncbi:hypothetical protein HanIR_Chr17g0896841 [Helianthus annuus]|nr:hypothetical protein HanIR_Chr17g0896841 [Helianthus annuus]
MAQNHPFRIIYRIETETGSFRAYHLVSEPRWLVSVSVWSALHRKTAGNINEADLRLFCCFFFFVARSLRLYVIFI